MAGYSTYPRWKHLEEWISAHMEPGFTFTNRQYADDTDISPMIASEDIQRYQAAQRMADSRTLFVLKRKPGTRTSTAVWMPDVRMADARAVGKTLGSDVHHRVMQAFLPDLTRIKAINPRTAKLVEARIESVVEGALKVLEGAVNGLDEDAS